MALARRERAAINSGDSMEGYQLTTEAQAERDQFESTFGSDGNCSCHLSPPCSSCIHPGNPLNQDEDETCWESEQA